MDTQTLLSKLDTAYKAITTTDMGQGLLTEEKASQFIRVVQDSTPLLSLSRRLPMNSHTRDIDRIMFAGRILQQTGGETTPITNEQKTVTYMNQLVAKELGGFFGITDMTLEDNIERGNLENTIIQLGGEQVGRDLEYLFLAGDSASSDGLLKTTNGWLKKAANKVTGVAADPTASQFLNNDVEGMLDKLLQVVPKKYMTNLTEWRYFCTWDIINDYRDKLKGRQTALGDSAQTGANQLAYKGIVLDYVPQMPAGTCLLAPYNNLVYGIWREIRIEQDRVPKERKTDFVVTLRADCHYEDENASAVATGYVGV
jgi:HK97 family phage major capsid protein